MGSADEHNYRIQLKWTGNLGIGTSEYTKYSRAHVLQCEGKPVIAGSSDPAFRGDSSRYNPEELLVGALSACHMLWYLHLCADAGVVVTDYEDSARGTLQEQGNGSGAFSAVMLEPIVTIGSEASRVLAEELHHRAHEMCFLANSVRFPVKCRPRVVIAAEAA